MSFVSYAQNFEDVVLWRALGDVLAGSYLDIGAQDPIVDSVSLAFYKAGWRGIHVEPTPAYAARLREERPDEVVIEAAVSDAPGPLELHEFSGTGLSTGKSEIAIRHMKQGFSGQKIMVPCVRLDKLFETAGDIHWMKIDVEGMESEVLASWRKSSSRPWVLVIEATSPMEQSPTDHPWRHEVERRGYSEVYFDGLSRYFLHEDHAALAERFEVPANVFDRFQVSSHHFSIQQFAQNAGNEISEAGRRTEQLQAELSMTNDQLATASADADQAEVRRAATEERALALKQQLAALSVEVDVARAERVAAIEALAKAREEYSLALDQAWRERHAFEIGLREQWSAKEQEVKRADAAREAELRDAGMRAAALDERVSRQGIEIEQLANAKDALERRIEASSKEIAELHLSYRSAAGDDRKRAQTERDHLFKELAQREAELSVAKTAIDRRGSDIDALNAEIAALHASHRSETSELEERAQQERDRLSSELADREAELSAAKGAIDRSRSDISELERTKDGLGQRVADLEAEITVLKASHRSETSALEERAQMEEGRHSRELANLGAEVASAKAVIEQALAEPIGRWQRLAQFFNPAREDRAHGALRSWASRAVTVQPFVRPDMSSPLATALKNPYLRADSLRELLSWHDVDFVRCAYVTVLGRQPDPDGEIYYTDRIRGGHSKMEVLWQLRRSEEGAEHDPGIAGFDRALRRHRNATMPVLGSMVRALTGREGDSSAERRFRALDNHVAAMRHEQMLAMAAIQHRLEFHSAELEAIHTESQAIGKSVVELHARRTDRGIQQGLPEIAPTAPHEHIPDCPPALGPTAARLFKRIKLLATTGDGPTKCAS